MNYPYKKKKDFVVNIKDKETGYGKKVHVKQYELPSGITENFYTTVDGNSVQIFPITKKFQEVYLVKQWRPGIESFQLEVPGGGLNEGEDPKKAAARELKEETGLKVDDDNLIHLATLSYSPYSSGVRHLFLAVDCVETNKQDLDPNEFLEVQKYSLSEVKEKIKNGSIRGTDLIYMGLDKLGML
jgi:ADP-ribose pyrophosphatase